MNPTPWSSELAASQTFDLATPRASRRLLVAASVAVGFALTTAVVAAVTLARFALLG